MDIKQGNADLFNIHSCAYVESVAERRKLWLDNSRIKLDVQRELNALPIDTFSCTAKSSADLLGSKATDRLKQELESRKSAHDYNLGQLSVSAIKYLSSGQKQNHQPSITILRPLSPLTLILNPFVAGAGLIGMAEVVAVVAEAATEERRAVNPVQAPLSSCKGKGLLPNVPVGGCL